MDFGEPDNYKAILEAEVPLFCCFIPSILAHLLTKYSPVRDYDYACEL